MMALKKLLRRAIKPAFLGLLVVFCSGAAGEICGSFFETTAESFGSGFPDNKTEDIRSILSDLDDVKENDTKPENSAATPIAVMVVKAEPRALVAWNMKTGKEIWKIAPPISSEIAIGSDSVVFKSGNDIAAYRIADGQLAWSYPIEEGFEYYGADIEDGVVAISIGIGGGVFGDYSNGRVIVRKEESGSHKFTHDTGGGLLGRPVLHGDYVFLPWDKQKIVAIDLGNGEEACRVRASDYTINHVEAGNGGVYFGMLSTKSMPSGIFRFDEASATGTREGSTMFIPDLEPVPGDPPFQKDAFAKPIPGRSSDEKIRFHWKPFTSSSQPIAMTDNQYYLHYWRYIIALDVATSRVRWTYRSEKDIESISATLGGVAGVDSNGQLIFIDARTGEVSWKVDTGYEVSSAVFDAEGFKPSAPSANKPDPIEGLSKMISDRDNRMLPIRSWAVSVLAKEPVPEVTRDLLEIYSLSWTPKGLRTAIVKAIESRKVGTEYLVDALNTHYDFLDQKTPPPMNVVAPALANTNERKAVPGLLYHLMSHETPIAHLAFIAASIHHLGDASVVTPLKRFLTLYHADSSFLGNEDALAMTAETILKLDNQQMAIQFLSEVRADDQTLPKLTKLLGRILDPISAVETEAKELAEKEKKEKEKEEADKVAKVQAEKASFVPRSLTRQQINNAVVTGRQQFGPCVQIARTKTPTLQSIRMRFVVAGATGKGSGLKILPNNIPGLQECLDAALDTIEFPLFKNHSQTATYSIRIQTGLPQ